MHYLSLENAWTLYRQAAPLLPSPPPLGSPAVRRVGGVAEILDTGTIDGVVLDAYGVLHTGSGLFAEAAALHGVLRHRGIPFCILTNDVTRPPVDLAASLSAMGFEVRADEIVSGHSVLEDALAPYGGGAGFAVLASFPQALTHRFPGLWAGTFAPDDLDRADGFVFVDTNTWTDEEPGKRLGEALVARPRPLIVCNPDITCPYQGRYSWEPGATAFPLALQHPEIPVHFMGKPWPGVYARVLEKFPGVPPSRILAVGDTPQTDILGAGRAGLSSLLVEGGLLKGTDALERCQQVGIMPTYIAPTV